MMRNIYGEGGLRRKKGRAEMNEVKGWKAKKSTEQNGKSREKGSKCEMKEQIAEWQKKR